MTPNAKDIARLAVRERALTGLFARIAGELEGFETPLVRLCKLSDDVALTVYHAERQYALAFASGSPASRKLALEGFEAVQKAAGQFLGSEAAEVRQLLAGRIELLAGGPGAMAARAEQLAGTAEGRASRRVERILRRWEKRDVLGAAITIEDALLTAVTAVESSPAKDAVLLYLTVVRPNDHMAWRTVAQRAASIGTLESKLAKVRAAGGLEAFGEAKFRVELSSELGNLKGVLGEVYTWRSRPWLLRERQLVRTGSQRGRLLAAGGADFRPHVVREPLLLGRGEIYDGSVMLARPLSSRKDVQVYEAYLHATLQVQTRERIELFDVLKSDIDRELARRPNGLTLRTADYSKTFIVRPPPDGQSPTRYIVAPMLDQARAVTPPPGAQVVFLPQLLSSDEFSELALLFLKSFI